MGWKPAGQTVVTAIHAALLPTKPKGQILCFGGYVQPEFSHAALYDVESAQAKELDAADVPSSNAFCGGHCFLSDGRWLVGGGTVGWPSHAGPHGDHYDGERRCWIYEPANKRFVTADPMNFQPNSSTKGGGRWYPTLVTLANGEALAVGGHPDTDDDYAPPPDNVSRHNNNTPEIYAPSLDAWRYVMNGNGVIPLTRENGFDTDSYPRIHLRKDGRVFFATSVRQSNRLLDPFTGEFLATEVPQPPEAIYREGSRGSSVVLPLLPADGYQLRVLVVGAEKARLINADQATPQWQETAGRDWPTTPPVRNHCVAIILPTGRIFVCGGCSAEAPEPVDKARDDSSVRPAELYDPGIDWPSGTYTGSPQKVWTTVESATVKRHYHFTALLLPDGSVWTAGSNRYSPTNDPDEIGEKAVEIYEPAYGTGRPTITAAPANLGYNQSFLIETPQSASVQRVALLRCGSCTHALDSDQRYVGLSFKKAEPGFLEAVSPPHGGIAPPGWYMLFIVDDKDRPCALARFVRVSAERLTIVTDRTTFSQHEVESFGVTSTVGASKAVFDDAFRVILDGFIPQETTLPDISLVGPNDTELPDVDVQLAGVPKYEGDSSSKLIAQRISFKYRVVFKSTQAFANVPAEGTPLTLKATHGPHTGVATLWLSKDPNPFMLDGDPPWLSVDVRAFRVAENDDPFAGVTQGAGANAPFDYLKALLAKFNAPAALQVPIAQHPFESISGDQDKHRLALFTQDAQQRAICNYAVARVRFRAPVGVNAEQVRLIFRLFTTITPGLEYRPEIYPLDGSGPQAKPLLGLAGGEVVTIPFFAELRKPSLADQTDDSNVFTLEGAGNKDVTHYFGCYLDVNRPDENRFPLKPDNAAGAGSNPLPILKLLRGLHQCLVAEVHYPPDAIPPNATPGSSDNLSQRNLLFDQSDNPGGLAAHLVHHSFELKPSTSPLMQPLPGEPVSTGRAAPDELVIEWGAVPMDSYATLYMPDVDVDAVLAFARNRQGPPLLSRVDAHTLRCRISPTCYIPLPGPRSTRIPGLLTIQLPPDLAEGQRFTIVARQVSGPPHQRRFIGSFEFEIDVSMAVKLRPELERRLSLLKFIFESIPAANRWHAVFVRWIDELSQRVRALGGDPDRIAPSPTGRGEPPAHVGLQHGHRGTVCEVLYGCFGEFEGFVLDTCPGRKRFRSSERRIERLVRDACRERAVLIVYTTKDDGDRPRRIVWGC